MAYLKQITLVTEFLNIEWIPRTKKWYKPWEMITYLPDRYFFDSDETRELWEKIQKT